MFKLGKEFHLLHVVSDLDAADGWYDASSRCDVSCGIHEGGDAQSVAGSDRGLRHGACAAGTVAGLGEIGAGQILYALRTAFSFDRLVCGRFGATSTELEQHKIRHVRHGGQSGYGGRAQAMRSGRIRRILMPPLSSRRCRNSLSTRGCSRAGRRVSARPTSARNRARLAYHGAVQKPE